MAERVEDELAFWRHAWDAAARMGARVLQLGYDWMTPGAGGYGLAGEPGGPVDLARAATAAIRQHRPPGSYFLDLEMVSGMMGREAFYDPRRYYWTKQPFSERGTIRLAEHLFAGVRALTTGPKKVLVLDLDNTLWGGVVGETGPLGVALGESPDGEAYRAFQKHAKALSRRGIVLAVASKNNEADGREPFEKNPEMVLGLDDIAAAEINWEPKGTTIRRIAEALSLGLDSFVFFDDNPAEGEQVRQAIPEVAVVEVPAEPAEYIRALEAGLWFETAALTEADAARAEQYAVERKRRELQQTAGTMEDYLRSLEMRADVRRDRRGRPDAGGAAPGQDQPVQPDDAAALPRGRAAAVSAPDAIGVTVRVEDRFGDHGLIGVLIAVPAEEDPRSLRVDTWLMSCRVIGRTVEEFFVVELLERARGWDTVGSWASTSRRRRTRWSASCTTGWGSAGSRPAPTGRCIMRLEVEEAERPVTYLVSKQAACLVESA